MEGNASFGYWVRRQRKALDLTQAELARRVGCAEGTIRMIEADARRPSRQIAARLAEQLAIAPADRSSFIQIARAERSIDRLAPVVTLERHRTNLPPSPPPLIGRAREVAQVCTLLRTPNLRLLTLTGPGGVGKTRLALHAAAELLGDFADGSYLVNLAPITDADLVMSAIAQALQIREVAGQPLLSQLQDYLRDKHLLLLLDNFEQVLGAATVVSELLAACPRLTMLVTSRTMLHLHIEKELAVPPLALPDLHRALLPATMAQYASVELFLTRARDSQPGFALTPANAPAVAEICTRLDGLPLAIELAATRIKLLDPQALLEHLGDRLTLLTGGARDLPLRQQTLRNTIDWSYHLLDGGAQALFRQLGVFVGGCTLQAVAAVSSTAQSTAGDRSIQALDSLTALVDQSLLRPEVGPDGASRFVMLETIREYAVEQLAVSDEATALRERHAAYYLALAERAEAQLHGAEQVQWLDRLEAEHDNMRAALAWSQTVAESGATGAAAAADLGLRLASALGWFWYMRGYWSEGRAWLAVALARGDAAPALERAAAHTWLGELETNAGDQATAQQHYAASLAIGRALDDKQTIATALRGVAMCLLFGSHGSQRDIAGVTALVEESLTLCREIGDVWNLAKGLQWLGHLAEERRDYGRAATLYDESLALFRRLHDHWHITLSLLFLGKLARYQGDYARAEPLYDECRALAQQLHARAIEGDALIHLGNLARYQADYDRAAAYYDAGLALLRDVGDQPRIASVMQDQGYLAHQRGDQPGATVLLNASLARCRELVDPRLSVWCLAGLGRVAVAQGQLERAAQLFGTTAALFDLFDPRMDPTDLADYECAVAVTRGQLDAATFAAAWATGRAVTLEQVITEALQAAE